MATKVIGDEAVATAAMRRQRDRHFDKFFLSGMAVVILASVFVGFARSYYLAGLFKAPLPNLLVHVHGAVFSCWILVLIVQTSLVSVGRVDVHRRLGMLGFGLACLVVVSGLLVVTDWQVRHFAAGEAGVKARAFYTVTLSTMLAFSTLIYFDSGCGLCALARSRQVVGIAHGGPPMHHSIAVIAA